MNSLLPMRKRSTKSASLELAVKQELSPAAQRYQDAFERRHHLLQLSKSHSQKQLAKMFGISRTRVQQLIAQAKAEQQAKQPPPNPNQLQLL